MEAAYGLAIVLCMIMTTTLLTYFMIMKRVSLFIILPLILLYLVIEFSFLLANLEKFHHGGYVTLLIAAVLIFIMFIWFTAKKISKN